MENKDDTINICEDNANKQDKVKILLNGLAAGECKGIKGATAYKIVEYAQQKGLA
ncbi:MAG: hypothetical protein LUC92_08645 [Clostridiales bacterium]|nr:hypothetical protein [Clostridiales bacterium]